MNWDNKRRKNMTNDKKIGIGWNRSFDSKLSLTRFSENECI
jgi:hypothetical protein